MARGPPRARAYHAAGPVSPRPEAASGIAEAGLCGHIFGSRFLFVAKLKIAMSDAPPKPVLPVADSIGEIQVFPRPVVWTAGLVIVALAGFGLYQGVRGVISGGAAGSGQEGGQPSGDAVSAAAAAAISSSAQWSALNGPAMSSASSQKAASAAQPTNSDDSDDSDEPESAAPAAVSAAPPAPPAPSAEQPVPMPDSSAPPAPAAPAAPTP